MHAARADAQKRSDARHDSDASSAPSSSSSSDQGTTGPSASASGTKTPAEAGDEKAKKDDDKDATADTSIASTMLALIGVPPKVTDVASKALGALKNAVAGKTGDALSALAPGAGDAATVASGVKDGLTNPLAGTTTPVATDTAAAGTPFVALLAAQGVAARKDEAPSSDLTGTSPMPLAHTQGQAFVDGPALQVQATQAATSPQFTQELGEQIAWMGSGDVKEARIKLHPEELGSMDVRVNMDGGKVNIAIIAQHPAAVHAVQQTLSQLDTLLAHHGLSLGQTNVGQGGTQQGGGQSGTSGGTTGADDGGEAITTVATSAVSRGLVDEVA